MPSFDKLRMTILGLLNLHNAILRQAQDDGEGVESHNNTSVTLSLSLPST